MDMTIEGYSRLVPAQEATFHLKARTHCAAPILEVTHKIYVIEGELGEVHSAIWVEDLATGKQRGNKLLVKGSAALNRGALLLLGGGCRQVLKPKMEEIPPQ